MSHKANIKKKKNNKNKITDISCLKTHEKAYQD